MLNQLLGLAPSAIRDLAVTAGSTRLQIVRRSGEYGAWRRRYKEWRGLTYAKLVEVQQNRLQQFLRYASEESPYYRSRLKGLPELTLRHIPILEKVDLQANIDRIVVGDKRNLVPCFTGGTTGSGITVYSRKQDLQERFAILDSFWEMHGFHFGRARIAWFSGRQLVWDRDVQKKCFWRNNWLYKVRYYSTFHMSQDRLGTYVQNLCAFRPRFFSGFPSAISELARFIELQGVRLPFTPEAIFVTSETLTADQRDAIERVFRCKVRDQYCASEGAPFIVECPSGSLHLDITTGVTEVVDDRGNEADEGEMLVTAFFTRGTPIIRYRIGDSIKLSPRRGCPCGWDTPLVEQIHGRTTDYVEVPGRGKVFCSQIGDCVKGVSTVLKFQVEMCIGALQVYLVADPRTFEARDKTTFLHKIHERMGDVPVVFHYVDDIPRARSGKHTVVRKSSPL